MENLWIVLEGGTYVENYYLRKAALAFIQKLMRMLP